MLPILNLASQLNKNLHFNHFQSVLGYEYVQGQDWIKATRLETCAEKRSVCKLEAPPRHLKVPFREITLNQQHLQAADLQAKEKPEKAWAKGVSISFLFFTNTQSVVFFVRFGHHPEFSTSRGFVMRMM